jgi:glycosyltransferase involved in cell wall biosynthesis
MSKIAFLVTEYPPTIGGIARYTLDVARFFRRLHPVTVILVAAKDLPPCPDHPYHHRIDPQILQEQPSLIAKGLVRDGTTVLFANHINLMGPRTVAAFRRAGLKCGCFFYGADINLRQTPRGYLRIYAACALLHHRIVISEGTRTIFQDRFPGLDTHLLSPGIELQEQAYKRYDQGDGIIAVGRLVRRKGFDTLLDVLCMLEREGLRPRMTLVGDGPDRAWLEDRCRQLDVGDRVRILSGLSDSSIREELRSHRVFCLLPREMKNGDVEGFGIVFLEAAREGLPVVAGRSGGVPDAVNDQMNGFLVDPDDAANVAYRLRLLLTDDKLWERQSAEGLEWYRKFAWELRDPKRELAFLVN